MGEFLNKTKNISEPSVIFMDQFVKQLRKPFVEIDLIFKTPDVETFVFCGLKYFLQILLTKVKSLILNEF